MQMFGVHSLERDFVYFKKLFLHFTRDSNVNGYHNILLDDYINDVRKGRGVAPTTHFRKFLNEWYEPNESYKTKTELKNAMNIWDIGHIRDKFIAKNTTTTGTKYHPAVTSWMLGNMHVNNKKDKCLAEYLTCSDMRMLVESLGSTHLHFSPSKLCTRCGKEAATLEHCVEKCLSLNTHNKVNLKQLLSRETGWRAEVNKMHRAVRVQKQITDISGITKNSTLTIQDDYRNISVWTVVDNGFADKVFWCHCAAAGRYRPIDVDLLSKEGRLSVRHSLDSESGELLPGT